jgi:hypothetical protein
MDFAPASNTTYDEPEEEGTHFVQMKHGAIIEASAFDACAASARQN